MSRSTGRPLPVSAVTVAPSAASGTDLATAATLDATAVLAALGTGLEGLTPAEANRRRAEYGPNAVRTHHARALGVLGHQLRSALTAKRSFYAAAVRAARAGKHGAVARTGWRAARAGSATPARWSGPRVRAPVAGAPDRQRVQTLILTAGGKGSLFIRRVRRSSRRWIRRRTFSGKSSARGRRRLGIVGG
jgi:hypothetical protein